MAYDGRTRGVRSVDEFEETPGEFQVARDAFVTQRRTRRKTQPASRCQFLAWDLVLWIADDDTSLVQMKRGSDGILRAHIGDPRYKEEPIADWEFEAMGRKPDGSLKT